MKLTALFTLSFILGTGVFASGCSAAPDEEEDVGTSEGELRSLGSDEIVGDIAFGTSTMEVQHPGETSSRRVYRALKVQANKGDVIDATAIVGNAADPVLYVLDSTFRTLKSNDDDRAGEKTSHVTYKATRTGTYYLAFRTKEGWRTKFYVSLRAKSGSTNPPPPVDPPPVDPPRVSGLDVFADTTERELTDSEVTSWFAPGTSSLALGTYRVVERRRTCNELTGCAPFAAGTTLHQLAGYVGWAASSWRPGIEEGARTGSAVLTTTQSGLRVSFGDSASSSEFWIGPCKLAQTATTCAARTVKSLCSTGGTGCQDRETSVTVMSIENSMLSFDVKLTSSFVYGRSRVFRSKSDASGTYTEAQFAYVASTKGKNVVLESSGETMKARFE